MKVVSVVGARPQFVKAAVVEAALERAGAERVQIHTGQHYDDAMSDAFFRQLGIAPPDVNLGVGSASHGAQTARMLEGIEAALVRQRPDAVVVYGDTNSTLAGALAAAKLHRPLAHVEAGLRSYNRRMPEELNRVLTDHAADLLFAPTEGAGDNLLGEGIDPARVLVVGDVMYDAALGFGERAGDGRELARRYGVEGEYVLATIHRAENTDDPARLHAIFGGLAAAARRVPVLLPLHPRTRVALERAGLLGSVEERLELAPPLGYLEMLALEKSARLVVTDSGGVQKEAMFQRVRCVTLRTETEWVELVELGWNEVVPPTDADSVEAALLDALEAGPGREPPAGLYGGGAASERVARALTERFG